MCFDVSIPIRLICSTDGLLCLRSTTISFWHTRCRRGPSTPTGVKHGGDAEAGAEMPWIGGDRHHRLGRRLEQQIVHHSLVLPGNLADLRRQGEDDMEIADR